MDISRFIIVLVILAVFAIGIVLLQIYLSNKHNKWLGRILPIISFSVSVVLALIMLFSMVSFEFFSETNISSYSYGEDGQVIEKSIPAPQPFLTEESNTSPAGIVLTFAVTFLLFNIPTVILLVIYFACRQRFKQNREINKMSVQDL
jgi:amino acid transporter